ncbi:GGDEF domain-containing protein [Vibrio rumoiensis]|uniref:GGDEF domain-containing protein n=1 Tax=Vibrio rumoiensis TaxID=76258 RepID=UPI00130197EF|nr:GGDEF domain-containing protein [Vibrio rumoiensis]
MESTLKTAEINLPDAQEIIRSNAGKEVMENVAHHLSQLNSQERLFLEQHKSRSKELNAYINTVIAMEFLVMVFFAMATFSIIRKSLFEPLNKLVQATKKMESGERQKISDFLPKDEIGYLMTSFYEMSEVIIERHEELETKAHTDELTGVNNRLGLYDDIQVSVSSTQSSEGILTLCFIDLDGFKQINDTLGHDYGDEMLKVVAQRLQSNLRSTDTVYRYGGDEFVVLIKGMTTLKKAKEVASSMMIAVSDPLIYRGKELEVKLSMGVALAPEHTVDAETLVKYADMAMYESKREGLQSPKFFYANMLDS